jgi:hypothetical protein
MVIEPVEMALPIKAESLTDISPGHRPGNDSATVFHQAESKWLSLSPFSSPSVADRWFSPSRADAMNRVSTLHNGYILFFRHLK